MTDTRRSFDVRAYARALENEIQTRCGTAYVFSSRDWELVRRWHDHGVPIGLVIEVMDDAGARVRRGLGAIATRVAEAWRIVEDGRIERPDPGPDVATPAGEPWDPSLPYLRAIERLEPGPAREAIERALVQLRRGVRRGRVDAELDRALLDDAPELWVEPAERRAREQLRSFAGRMPPDRIESARRRAVVDSIRKRLGLPESAAG